MKFIIAVIRPEALEAVQTALAAAGVVLMTASDVRGCGRQRGVTESYWVSKGVVRLLPKVKLEIAVNDEYVKPTIDAILRAGKSETDRVGDGKIFVLPLEECHRIRTGEQGSAAIGP